jgi:rSAM/selenodomain-associated transferase 2
MAERPALSIVLPALNEAAAIAPALARLRAQAPQAELLVVDGGSTDGTPALAAPHARVLASAPGRARQLNLGARESRGDWLLFLHVDTALPDGFPRELERAARRGCEAGAFRLRIAGRHPLLPLLAWSANLRTRWRHVALGDQALFCTRRLFEAQGGFPDLPLLEDYVFTLRLRRAGIPLCLARTAVVTSGRRWEQRGFWRTWWQFRRIYWQFRRRPDFQRLRAGYEDVR